MEVFAKVLAAQKIALPLEPAVFEATVIDFVKK